MSSIAKSQSPSWEGESLFIGWSKQISHLPHLRHLDSAWEVHYFQGEKKRQPFLHASWDHGNFQCQEFTTVSGNSACSHLPCWSVKGEEVGPPGGCLCFMPVVPEHSIFVNAFQSGYNCALCQNHKAPCGAPEREHWEEIWPSKPSQPHPKGKTVGEHSTSQVCFSLFFQSPVLTSRTRLSGEGEFCRGFPKVRFNPGFGKLSTLNLLQSQHHSCLLCRVSETFRARILPRSNNVHIFHDDLKLDVPEPANVRMIVREFALMVSDSRRGVTFTETDCFNSRIQMLCTSASFLIIFTVRLII